MRPTRFVTRFTAIALIAAAGTLVGCDQQDQISAEIQRADLVLNSVSSVGYTALPTGDRKREDLQWVINRLTGKTVTGIPKSLSAEGVKGAEKHRGAISSDLPTLSVAPVDSSDPLESAAANLLVARAQAGLAELKAQEQQEKEAALLNQISIIRASMNEWTTLNMLANGQEAYNPAQDIARFEQQIAERETSLNERKSAKAQQDAAIAALAARAQEATTNTETQRTREAELRNQMTTGTQTQRAALLEQITEVKRAGDALEMQAANLQAEIAKEQPKADIIEREVNLATKQIELLRNAITATNTRAESSRQVAARARATAAEAAGRLDQLISDAKGLRTNADGPGSEALSHYQQALSAAKKAQTALKDAEARGSAAAAVGSFSQSMGDVHAARARGLGQFGDLLASIASDRATLPNAATYRADADTLHKGAEEARKAAKEAYSSAQTSYATANFKTRAEEIQKKIEDLAKSYDSTLPSSPSEGEAPAPSAGEDETPAGEGAQAPAGGDFDKAAVETEARAFLTTLVDAAKAGDTNTLLGAATFADAEEGQVLARLLPLGVAVQKLNTVATEKFSKPLAELVRESKIEAVKTSQALMLLTGMGGAAGGSMTKLNELNLADLSIEATATDAVSVSGDGRPSFELKKTDGQWKVVLPSTGILASPMGAQLKLMGDVFSAMAEATTGIADKTTAGEYSDADAMLVDLNAKIIGAMSKMPTPAGGN